MFNVWDVSANEGMCAARRLGLNISAAPLIRVAASTAHADLKSLAPTGLSSSSFSFPFFFISNPAFSVIGSCEANCRE